MGFLSAQFRVMSSIGFKRCLHLSTRFNQQGMVQRKIQQKLQDLFEPEHLEIINESFMHNVPKGSETHFKIILVSKEFQGQNLVQRHRQINKCLMDELQTGVHALSIALEFRTKMTQVCYIRILGMRLEDLYKYYSDCCPHPYHCHNNDKDEDNSLNNTCTNDSSPYRFRMERERWNHP